MLRRLTQLLLFLAVAGAFAWAFWPRPLEVETVTIGRHDITVSVAEEGKARIREIYTVSAPFSGQTVRVERHAGDNVAKDDLLFAIRPAPSGLLDMRLRRMTEAAAAAAQASVDLAAAEVKQAETQLSFLRTELARAEQLASQNAISASALDKARLAVESGSASLDSAKASLEVRARELDRARAALTEVVSSDNACCANVTSPVSGKILRVFTESEQVIQAGAPVVQIGDPTDIEVSVDLLSQDSVDIRPGAQALIENWGGPPLAATVRRVEPSAVSKTSALGIEEQRVPVILDLTDKDKAQALGDGFRVIARITVWQGGNLLAVPIAALFRSGDSWAVFTVAGGHARLQPLTVGRRNDEFAEITSGLQEGSRVILHPSDQIADGSSVTEAP